MVWRVGVVSNYPGVHMDTTHARTSKRTHARRPLFHRIMLHWLFCDAFTDINECQGANGCHVNSTCTNNHGSYQCNCQVGFHGDGKNCGNVNECSLKSDSCDKNANCKEIVGSYLCQCLHGYTGNGRQCTDINECSLGIHNCQSDLQCKNTPGFFTCQCPKGFTWNGTGCENINACFTNMHTCSKNAFCLDSAGQFTCICRCGYTGSGHQCQALGEAKQHSFCFIIQKLQLQKYSVRKQNALTVCTHMHTHTHTHFL